MEGFSEREKIEKIGDWWLFKTMIYGNAGQVEFYISVVLFFMKVKSLFVWVFITVYFIFFFTLTL